MDYTVDGKSVTLYLKGELDHHTVKGFITATDRAIDLYLPVRLIFDFASLDFMDSSGIALILGSYRKMLTLGGRLSLVNVGYQPSRVLAASGVYRLISKEGEAI